MKKQLFLLLSASLLLGSCQSEPNDITVTFDALREGSDTVTLKADENGKVASTDEVDDLVRGYEYHKFKNWYTSKEAAESLDAGENNENIFNFENVVTSSITVYAGYTEKWIDDAVTEKVELTLGSYQVLGYSPLPLLEKTPYSDIEDDYYSFKALNVTAEKNAEARKLLEDEGFSETEDNLYQDKLGRYYVNLAYVNNELKYTISFKDEEGQLPAYELGTLSSAMDATLYLDPEGFTLAKNEKGEDLSKKFIVTQKYGSILSYMQSQSKTLYYMPKDTDESPAQSFGTYLTGVGYSKASNTSLIYMDMFMSSIVSISTVTKFDLQTGDGLVNRGVKIGMVAATFYSAYTVGLDQDLLVDDYESLTGKDYPESFPGLSKIGNAFSVINAYSSGSNYGPGFYVSDCNKEGLNEVLFELNEQGYTYSESEGSYYWKFSLTSGNGEYNFSFSYYDSTKISGLLSDVCQVVIIRTKTAYETLSEWMVLQNQGGGSLTSVPELPCSKVKGSSSSTYPYMYTLIGYNAQESDVNTYVTTLTSAGFTKTKEENNVTYLSSADGYYTILVNYSSTTGYLYVYVYYNCTSESKVRTVEELTAAAKLRLGVTELEIPYLSTYLASGEVKTTTMSLYSSSLQRYMIYGEKTTEENVDALVTAFEAAADEAAGWTFAGTNSAGTVNFYVNADEVYLYCMKSSVTNDDKSVSYRFVIGLYK